MKNFYYHSENDYTIKNSEGKFLTQTQNMSDFTFTDDPNKSISVFRDCAIDLITNFNNDPDLIDYKNCVMINRNRVIEEYNKQQLECL